MMDAIAILLLAPNVTPSSVVPVQWTFNCPSSHVGADGQFLCRASHVGYPKVEVERTDQGMKISTISQCGVNENPNALSKYRYRNITIIVSLKPDATPEKVEKAFFRNLNDIPKISQKFCGLEHGYKEFVVKKDQVPNMIEILFFNKKSPY